MLPDHLHPPSLSPATHPLLLIFQPPPPYPAITTTTGLRRTSQRFNYAVMAGPSVAQVQL